MSAHASTSKVTQNDGAVAVQTRQIALARADVRHIRLSAEWARIRRGLPGGSGEEGGYDVGGVPVE